MPSNLLLAPPSHPQVTRNIVDGATGKAVPVEETLELPIKAGFKDGTKLCFTGAFRLAGGECLLWLSLLDRSPGAAHRCRRL